MVQQLPLNTGTASYSASPVFVAHCEPKLLTRLYQFSNDIPVHLHRVPHPNSIQMSCTMSYLERNQSYMTEVGGYF